MRTNIDLDEKILKEAMSISGLNTKKAVVNMALEEYVRASTRKEMLNFKGKNIWEGAPSEKRTKR
ncbi:type II toxin-antitoxin system VapB family antitoxin [Brucepastera parasyntrophica]|uniref:type II toxin-antitoxin system VapB family antitoxin n=1 Tax=Brucepastera parasyntrophica TaxID=2880008 RepID=UPI00210EB73B|nr:type II toxin-antitoxin system VapB family antitoxin [Brucepastera parasyntrophica]ULQ59138.1 type II toxin-antitoxin system VapB family antitoxin [Brucepastera parasyntrophica]